MEINRKELGRVFAEHTDCTSPHYNGNTLINKAAMTKNMFIEVVNKLFAEREKANDTNTDSDCVLPVINSRLSELEEENRLLKLIIENGLGAEDLENDCL